MIVEYSSDYFSKYPSQRSNFDICNPDLYPNNTVQFIKYQPETERYGGPIGINIAEKQFEISSEAVIRLLQQYPTISYEGRLFAAIQLHLGFVYSFGFTKEEIYSFFHTIEQMMLMHVLNLSSSTDKRTEQEKKILAAFVNSYEKQSAMLINYSGDIWNALHKNMKFDSPWMEYWTNNLKHIHEALSSAFLKGLILPDKYQRPNKLWYIYESYIHMTNNRLGILNCDEAYLAYLICRVIKEI
jgi:thiopeptide-type bacteriocin biosynthesis protein